MTLTNQIRLRSFTLVIITVIGAQELRDFKESKGPLGNDNRSTIRLQ